MPTYDYRCDGDKTLLSYTRTIQERDNPVACPNCGEDMRREYIATPVHFKGSGFYTTDK